MLPPTFTLKEGKKQDKTSIFHSRNPSSINKMRIPQIRDLKILVKSVKYKIE